MSWRLSSTAERTPPCQPDPPSFGLLRRSINIVVAIDEPIVINLADAPAIGAPRGATFIKLEPDGVSWPDTGVNVQVMQPGEPNGRYHSEPVQEDFLVLYGECIAIVENEERTLRRWDFLHCPAGIEHIFVGAGDGPCAVLMIGSRREDACHYAVNETAAKYGARCRKRPTTRSRRTPTGARRARTSRCRTRCRPAAPGLS